MSITVAQLRTSIKDAFNAEVQTLGLSDADVISETANGEALTDVVATVLGNVRTISPNNVKYPKVRT